MKKQFLVLMLVIFAVTAGCSSTKMSGERMDKDQIKRNADQGMQDLQKEEDRRKNAD